MIPFNRHRCYHYACRPAKPTEVTVKFTFKHSGTNEAGKRIRYTSITTRPYCIEHGYALVEQASGCGKNLKVEIVGLESLSA